MDFDFRDLEVFCRVVELGGFSKAARAVHLAQASVSERIAALERRAGTRLLDRLGRKTVATKAGRLLYERATQHLDLKRQTCEELEAEVGIYRGAITMGGSTIPGEYILPGSIARFRQQYPEVSVSVAIGDSQTIRDRVLEGDVELGVVGSTDRSGHLRYRKLWGDELVLAVPAGHRWALKKSVSIDELRDEPLIIREKGSGTRYLLEKHLAKSVGGSLNRLAIAAQLGSSTAVREGIKQGLGVSILSSRAVAADVAAGLLATLGIRGMALQRIFCLIRDRRRSPSALVDRLQRFLLAEAASARATPRTASALPTV